MLSSLTISNVVLIEQLSLSFEKGFCALTGETGAGKSILLDSLGLALGGRSETGLVRKGAEQAAATAVFDVAPRHPVRALLADAGIVAESGEPLVLRRLVGADGRSRAFVNDQPVSVGLLKQAGGLLVEIHGQFETYGLLDPKTHRALLDSYAGIDEAALAQAWDDWRAAQEKLDGSRAAMDKARAEEDYLRQAVEALDELAAQPGEEQKLAARRDRLMRRGQFADALNAGDAALTEAESAVNTAWRALDRVGDDAKDAVAALGRVVAELREAQAEIAALSSDVEDGEESLESVDDRLFALRGMARRHGCAPDGLPARRDELAAQLTLIEKQDDVLAGLAKDADLRRARFIKACESARATRQAAAEKMDRLVAKELPPLKLEKARFKTQVEPLPEVSWGPGGADSVTFLVATNPGGAPGPLNKIASGGEMARFMLALKLVLAEAGGAAGTLVFDEVDTGIGGATASAVGERLARLAKTRQILVVTHSPQVAARAGHHFIVLKDGKKDVKTKVIPLSEAVERREEIARMLSGTEITKEARAAAGKLLETGS